VKSELLAAARAQTRNPVTVAVTVTCPARAAATGRPGPQCRRPGRGLAGAGPAAIRGFRARDLCSKDRNFRFAEGKVSLVREELCFWHLLSMDGLDILHTARAMSPY
jgi:hypothetical protein